MDARLNGERTRRYQEIGARRGRAERTSAPGIDRCTGAAVVLQRHAGGAQRATQLDAARRAARLDHPALAPVIDVVVDGDDVVVVEADVPGRRLDGAPVNNAIAVVLAPLAEGVDALHAAGLAHGAIGAEQIVLAAFGGGLERPVLCGGPAGDADPASDRRDLAALARRLIDPAPAIDGARFVSCVALVDHLRREEAPPPAPPLRWHTRGRLATRVVPTGFAVLMVLAALVALALVR